MITDIVLVVLGFLWIIAASLFDIKTREIPYWISFSLICLGLRIRTIHSLFYWDYHYIFYGIIGLAAFFIFGNLMYFTKQWGGGDAKLLMGLGAVFGSYLDVGLFNPNINLPFIIILLFNILVAGAVYGIIYALVLGIINRKNLIPILRKQSKLFLIGGLLVALIMFFIGVIMDEILFLGFMALIFALLIIILFFVRAVDKISMIKKVNVDKLVEGDWLAKNIVKDNKIICSAEGLGVTKNDIERLKKNHIKEVLIKEGIPFAPSFLFGMIISFTFGNLIVIGP